MPYVIDRDRAWRTTDLVVVTAVHQRNARSRAVFKDNSLSHTLTRPVTLIRAINAETSGLIQIGRRAGKG